MATKTITLELDAYDRLVQARKSAKESFTNVVRRAHWDDLPPTAGEVLKELEALVAREPAALLDSSVLDEMSARRRTSRSESRWERQ